METNTNVPKSRTSRKRQEASGDKLDSGYSDRELREIGIKEALFGNFDSPFLLPLGLRHSPNHQTPRYCNIISDTHTNLNKRATNQRDKRYKGAAYWTNSNW